MAVNYRMLQWLGSSGSFHIVEISGKIHIPKLFTEAIAFSLSLSLCWMNFGLKPFPYLGITVSLTAELSLGSKIDYNFFMPQLLFFTSAGSYNSADGKHMFIGT